MVALHARLSGQQDDTQLSILAGVTQEYQDHLIMEKLVQ